LVIKDKKTISICIPVLNEKDNLHDLFLELNNLSEKLRGYNFEFVFSDNNSTDGTWEEIVRFSKSDSRVRGIRFSKNIGYQNSIIRNYEYSMGDALIQLDADLQDPIETIIEFVNKWEDGYAVVFGVRESRSEGLYSNLARRIGYSILNWASDSRLHKDVGDFRLIDRKVIDSLRNKHYRNPYLRGIVSSLGFKECGVGYSRKPRVRGESKFKPFKVIKLGLIGLFSFSTKPIRIFIPISIFSTFMALVGIIWMLFLYFSGQALPPGYTTTQILIFITIAINTSFFAIAGDYLLRIYFALLPNVDGYIVEKI
jgi:glycosyltransferase involved in cell wall biosynthesis